MQLDQWSAELAEALTSYVPAGVTVTDDERDLALPGVWFAPATVRPTFARGSYTVGWTVIVATAATAGPRDAARQLGALASAIVDEFGPAELELVQIAAPNLTPEPIPALRFTITTECEDN